MYPSRRRSGIVLLIMSVQRGRGENNQIVVTSQVYAIRIVKP